MDGGSQFSIRLDVIMGRIIITCLEGSIDRRIEIIGTIFIINQFNEMHSLRINYKYWNRNDT